MSSQYAIPSWIQEGAEVLVRRGTMGKSFARARVVRITATQVVVESRVGQERFRRSDLRLIGHRDPWRAAPTLVDPNAPEVVQALREQARDERFSRVSGLMRTKWVDVRNGDVEAAREVRAALDELLAREGQDTPDVSPE